MCPRSNVKDSTARLKSGADTRVLSGPPRARRDFRPTEIDLPTRAHAHTPTRS